MFETCDIIKLTEIKHLQHLKKPKLDLWTQAKMLRVEGVWAGPRAELPTSPEKKLTFWKPTSAWIAHQNYLFYSFVLSTIRKYHQSQIPCNALNLFESRLWKQHNHGNFTSWPMRKKSLALPKKKGIQTVSSPLILGARPNKRFKK